MTINLEKGQKISLEKVAPGLKRVRLGLGWNAQAYDNAPAFDLDASAFGLKKVGEKPVLVNDKFFIYYDNKLSPDGAISHSGDNRTGDGEGDDETIIVDLAKVDAQVDEISFIVTIYHALQNSQNFGQVTNSVIHVYDADDANPAAKPLAEYRLEDDFSTETAVQFGSLYRRANGWYFGAVGAGYKKGLADFVNLYGGDATGG